MAVLSRRRIPLAILVYEQFKHFTQIILRPIIQILSTPQHAYQSFLVTSWFYTVYNIVTRWVIFRDKHLHKHELQLSDYNMEKYFRPNVQILFEKYIFFPIFAYKFFKVKSKNCK